MLAYHKDWKEGETASLPKANYMIPKDKLMFYFICLIYSKSLAKELHVTFILLMFNNYCNPYVPNRVGK